MSTILTFSIFSKIIIDTGLKISKKRRWPTSKSMQAFLSTVPHLYHVDGKTVPAEESKVRNDKDWGYV